MRRIEYTKNATKIQRKRKCYSLLSDYYALLRIITVYYALLRTHKHNYAIIVTREVHGVIGEWIAPRRYHFKSYSCCKCWSKFKEVHFETVSIKPRLDANHTFEVRKAAFFFSNKYWKIFCTLQRAS